MSLRSYKSIDISGHIYARNTNIYKLISKVESDNAYPFQSSIIFISLKLERCQMKNLQPSLQNNKFFPHQNILLDSKIVQNVLFEMNVETIKI
jgi:hypothetical protein